MEASAPTAEAANTITGTNSGQMTELAKQIQRLTEEVAQLKKEKSTQSPRAGEGPIYAGDTEKEVTSGVIAQRLQPHNDQKEATNKEEPGIPPQELESSGTALQQETPLSTLQC